MTESVSFLTFLNWLGLVHPVVMILFVYPVVGATIRLGILARERRLDLNPIAPTVPVEHADHGRWVTGGMVLALIKLGQRWPWVRACLERRQLLEGSLFAQRVGWPDQVLAHANEIPAESRPYFSLLLIRQTWPGVLP